MDVTSAYGKLNRQTQESLVTAHAVLVKRIAYHLLSRLPASVQIDDLIQAGMMGLLEASKHYDETKGASFETYASIRIRGNMLDEIRRNDWVPRSVYRNSRVIASAIKTVENRLGREAKDCEIAAELNVNVNEFFEILKDSTSSQLFGFDDLGVTDDTLHTDNEGLSEPHSMALSQDNKHQLTQLIASLPHKEQLVLSLYYEHDLNLKEIGEVLGVSESRVSQIHTQATSHLKARMPDSR